MLQCGTHGCDGECISSQGAADPTYVGVFHVKFGPEFVRNLLRETVNTGRNSPCQRLAAGQEIGLQAVFPGITAWTGANSVCLVNYKQGSSTAGGLTQCFVIA